MIDWNVKEIVSTIEIKDLNTKVSAKKIIVALVLRLIAIVFIEK